MKRKVLTAAVVIGSLALGACTEDETMDELIQETQLNSLEYDPGDDPDVPAGG